MTSELIQEKIEQIQSLERLKELLSLRLVYINEQKVKQNDYEINERNITKEKTGIEINRLSNIIAKHRQDLLFMFDNYLNEP